MAGLALMHVGIEMGWVSLRWGWKGLDKSGRAFKMPGNFPVGKPSG